MSLFFFKLFKSFIVVPGHCWAAKSAFRLVFVVTAEVQDGFVISMEEEKREEEDKVEEFRVEKDRDPFCDGRQQLDDRLSNPLLGDADDSFCIHVASFRPNKSCQYIPSFTRPI